MLPARRHATLGKLAVAAAVAFVARQARHVAVVNVGELEAVHGVIS